MQFANNNKDLAVNLYDWNNRIGDSLNISLSYFEVVLRNKCSQKLKEDFRIKKQDLIKRNKDISIFQEKWYLDKKLLSGNNHKKGQWAIDEVNNIVEKIKKIKGEGCIIRDGDIISNLNFAFWLNLFFANYEHKIWDKHLQYIFSNEKRQILHKKINNIKNLRNRIFHHEPIIFDKI